MTLIIVFLYNELMFPLYWQYFKKLFDIGKKIALVVIVYFVVISLLLHFISKDRPGLTSDPIKRNRDEIYKTIQALQKNPTSENKIRLLTYRMTACGLIGEACTDKPKDGDRNFDKSLFGFVTNLIVAPYINPPASGTMWAYEGLQNAGFIPKTYAAQGIGFGTVQPFSKIWVAIRDIAYTILVLFIIAIGFMIMFRMKLNPQTVISVENSLPKIVISLILITFSFAIAGFMIDLMYVAIAVIVSLLGPIHLAGATAPGTAKTVVELQQKYLLAHPGDILSGLQKEGSIGFWTIFFELPNALLNLVPMVGGTIKAVGSVAAIVLVAPLLSNHFGGKIGEFFTGLTNINTGVSALFHGTWNPSTFVKFLFMLFSDFVSYGIAVWITGAFIIPFLIGLLIFLTVLFIFFRIFLMLLTSYIKILIMVVISPVYMLFEAIPGQSAFSGWLKGLLAELITFPAIVGLFLMGTIISDAASTGNFIQFPFLVAIDPKSFGFIIGMAVLFMTPDLVKAVKQILVPKPGILDTAGFGLFFGGATTGITGGLGEVSKYAGLGYYIAPLGSFLNKISGGIIKVPGGEHPPPEQGGAR